MPKILELWTAESTSDRHRAGPLNLKTHIINASGDSLCSKAKAVSSRTQISLEWLRQAGSGQGVCKTCLKSAKTQYAVETKGEGTGEISINNTQYKDAYVEIGSVLEYEIKVKSRKMKSYSFGAASAKFNLKTSQFDVYIDPRIAAGIGRNEFFSTKEQIKPLFSEIIESKAFIDLMREIDVQLSRL